MLLLLKPFPNLDFKSFDKFVNNELPYSAFSFPCCSYSTMYLPISQFALNNSLLTAWIALCRAPSIVLPIESISFWYISIFWSFLSIINKSNQKHKIKSILLNHLTPLRWRISQNVSMLLSVSFFHIPNLRFFVVS